VAVLAPGLMAAASILTTNPTSPTAPMPRKQILIDSQSSVLPGFMASFRVRAHWDRNVLSLVLICYSLFKFDMYAYVLMRITWKVCINFSLCYGVEGLGACVQRTLAPYPFYPVLKKLFRTILQLCCGLCFRCLFSSGKRPMLTYPL